jgi:activator of HSP90 ATPase
MHNSIKQKVIFKGSPKRVYEALTDSKKFSAVTGGAPAQLSHDAGASFTCFGGMIHGRNIELLPNQRIIQAWRAKTWADGVYSIVRFELKEQGAETKLIFEHSGFPEDQKAHLEGGWQQMYWEPLRKYLA